MLFLVLTPAQPIYLHVVSLWTNSKQLHVNRTSATEHRLGSVGHFLRWTLMPTHGKPHTAYCQPANFFPLIIPLSFQYTSMFCMDTIRAVPSCSIFEVFQCIKNNEILASHHSGLIQHVTWQHYCLSLWHTTYNVCVMSAYLRECFWQIFKSTEAVCMDLFVFDILCFGLGWGPTLLLQSLDIWI